MNRTLTKTLFVMTTTITLSCSDRHGVDPINQRVFDIPHVNGIWMYNAAGVAIGSWGTPWVPPTRYRPVAEITRTYPNPAVAVDVSVGFDLPTQGLLWLWIVKAVGPSEIEAQFESFGGAAINIPAGMPVTKIFEGQHLVEGSHRVGWSTLGSDGRRWPSGFYRINLHFEGDNGLIQDNVKDLLLIWEVECESIPWELREVVSCM